jgi:hypothetical protein
VSRHWLDPTPSDIPAALRGVAGETIAPFAADLITIAQAAQSDR